MNPKTLSSRFLLGLLCSLTGLTLISDAQSPPRMFSEVHVIRSMRQIHSAQATYQATTGAGNFGSLQNLLQAGFIDEALASGSKYGYVYVVSTVPYVPGQSPAGFTVTATPRAYRKSGIRSFFIDVGGELHGRDNNGRVATSGDPVIDDCTNGSIQENERCAIADMRALHSAEMTYAATVGNQGFGLLSHLYLAGLIQSDLADGVSRGYYFPVQIIFIVPVPPQPPSFRIWATPQSYGKTAIRSFFIDKTGVLRGGDKKGDQADENDPPITD
jgi:hypothetical protein